MSDIGLSHKKTILFIIPWMEIGGADKFNLDITTGLKRKGWQIIIFCTLKSENRWRKEFEKVTENIWVAADADYWHLGKSLYSCLIQNKVDIIFLTNSLFGYQILPWLKSVFPIIPVVDYLHCEELDWLNGGYPMVSASNSHLLDHTVASSNHLVEWCIEKGSDSETITRSYTSIDFNANRKNSENRNVIRKGFGIDNTTPIIIYVARLVEQKQPFVLIESLSRLAKMNRSFKCLIIGDGPYKSIVEAAIRKSPAKENIIFLGAQTNESVKQYMDASDIFFLPSLYEGIALSIYEAMAKELVIVATDTGGQKELVSTDCGFLVNRKETKNPTEKYAEILHQLLEDRSLRLGMGQNSRTRIEKYFAIETMIEEAETILMNVLAKPVKLGEDNNGHLLLLKKMVSLEKENEDLKAEVNGRLFKMAKKVKSVLKRKE